MGIHQQHCALVSLSKELRWDFSTVFKTSRQMVPSTVKAGSLQRWPSKCTGNFVTQQVMPILMWHIPFFPHLPLHPHPGFHFHPLWQWKLAKYFQSKMKGEREQTVQKRSTKLAWNYSVPKWILLQGRKFLLVPGFAVFRPAGPVKGISLFTVLYPVLTRFHFPSSRSDGAHPVPEQQLLGRLL